MTRMTRINYKNNYNIKDLFFEISLLISGLVFSFSMIISFLYLFYDFKSFLTIFFIGLFLSIIFYYISYLLDN